MEKCDVDISSSGADATDANTSLGVVDASEVTPSALVASAHRRGAAYRFFDKWATLIAFVVMIAFYWIKEPNSFGTFFTFTSILQLSSTTILLGVGLTAVLSVAEFDLSFPYLVTFTSAVTMLTIANYHGGTISAIVVGVGVGAVCGVVAGFVVSLQRASSFIVTLALGFIWTGIADGMTQSQAIVPISLPASFSTLTNHDWLGVSDTAWIALIFAVIVGSLIKWTVPGRYVTAIGSNPEASRMAGVKVGMYRTMAFLILGIAAGIAGVLLMAQQSSYTPGIGTSFFLPPYVAAFFGMSVLGTHRFTVFGTVIGGLFIATFQQGLLIMAAPTFVAELIEGLVLLVILTIIIRSDRTSR